MYYCPVCNTKHPDRVMAGICCPPLAPSKLPELMQALEIGEDDEQYEDIVRMDLEIRYMPIMNRLTRRSLECVPGTDMCRAPHIRRGMERIQRHGWKGAS